MTLPRPLLVAALALVSLGYARACHRAHREAEAREAAEAEVARARSDALADSLRAAGYAVALGVVTERLVLRDSAARALERQVATLGGRLAALAEARVEARGEVTFAVEDTLTTDSVRTYAGTFADGPLSGRLVTPVPLPWAALRWEVYLPISAALAWAPDGRPVVALRYVGPEPVHGTVDVEVLEFRYRPPPAPKVRGPSRIRWLLYGALAGAVGWEMVR